MFKQKSEREAIVLHPPSVPKAFKRVAKIVVSVFIHQQYIRNTVTHRRKHSLCNKSCHGKSIRNLDIKSEEHIGALLLTILLWHK